MSGFGSNRRPVASPVVKVFVSADIEGVCGATAWDEARKESPAYREFQRQMNREVAAACDGALAAGAADIVVKDARRWPEPHRRRAS